MQSELPKGDAALLAAIKAAKPVPTTKAQANELTPPPATGEWSYVGSDLVYEGQVLATCFSEPVAYRIVRELARADAMERALEEVSQLVSSALSDDSGPVWDAVCSDVLIAAEAALRK